MAYRYTFWNDKLLIAGTSENITDWGGGVGLNGFGGGKHSKGILTLSKRKVFLHCSK